VIRSATDFDGTERAPMRLAEARVTLGVVAARQGDVGKAVHHGERALTSSRKSLPSLVMVTRDLTRVLKERFGSEPATVAYLDQLQMVSQTTDLGRLSR
jgi:phosphatidate phosphatase APP1